MVLKLVQVLLIIFVTVFILQLSVFKLLCNQNAANVYIVAQGYEFDRSLGYLVNIKSTNATFY